MVDRRATKLFQFAQPHVQVVASLATRITQFRFVKQIIRNGRIFQITTTNANEVSPASGQGDSQSRVIGIRRIEISVTSIDRIDRCQWIQDWIKSCERVLLHWQSKLRSVGSSGNGRQSAIG